MRLPDVGGWRGLSRADVLAFFLCSGTMTRAEAEKLAKAATRLLTGYDPVREGTPSRQPRVIIRRAS